MVRPAMCAGLVVSLAVLSVGATKLVTYAQTPTASGSISGAVVDASGSPIPGAVVTTTHTAVSWTQRVVTDHRGAFELPDVPVGAIEMATALEGFVTDTRRVTVAAGLTLRLSITLRTGALSESIAVTAAPSRQLALAVGASPSSDAMRMRRGRETSADAYDRIDPSGFRRASHAPLSTFSVDVDTASYANARRFITSGALPPPDAVRLEEWVNYFRYDYPQPSGREPFGVTTALTSCPWNPDHQLLRLGLQGRRMDKTDTPPRNLVFLLDVSGSMEAPDKLPLLRTAMRMLVDELTARDRVAIVVYAGSTGLVLPPTRGDEKARIHEALARLQAGGSTNGGEGIALAYRTARASLIPGGVNRVILATDGDFNVGVTSRGDLVRLIERERAHGVFLSVFGVGRGNLKDSTLEQLADRGNGNYAYLDSLHEARRVLVQEAGATLVTIAKDVKIQVEFNPAYVGAYRLIGYENRRLADEDFVDDTKDAGEIGAGHAVTALYEIVPRGKEGFVPAIDALKYQTPAPTPANTRGELATVKLRYKAPDGDTSRPFEVAVGTAVQAADAETGFAAAVAEAGLVLRHDPHAAGASLARALDAARANRGADAEGYRAEFVRLLELAGSLSSQQLTSSRP